MYYFVSDTHFGMEGDVPAIERERIFARWLDSIAADARAIFLVGDIFDFWFEFRKVVPKGFTRVLGKLAELSDRGVEIHFFTGNHDMWITDYLTRECGVTLHEHGEMFDLYGKQVFIAHGDNLHIRRPFWTTVMQRTFRSKVMQWIFRTLLHPDWVVSLGHYWSGKSRKAHIKTHVFCGDKEYLVQFARKYQEALNKMSADYFVFGHIHCAHIYDLEGHGGRAVFLGEWLHSPAYAVLTPDGEMELRGYGATD